MASVIRRIRAALRHFRPEQNYWHDARLVVGSSGKGVIETYWRNPEIAGIWLLQWEVSDNCLSQLFAQELLQEAAATPEGKAYGLSAKGLMRLNKNS